MSLALHYNYRRIDQSKIVDEAEEIDQENVSEVYLKECNLENFPYWIYQLKNLTILKISYNKIEQIDDEIGELSHLELLDISHNNLTAINRVFFKLVKLKMLDFSANRIDQFPEGQFFYKKLIFFI
jgi:Leucine-rich repeat (LRR) protein